MFNEVSLTPFNRIIKTCHNRPLLRRSKRYDNTEICMGLVRCNHHQLQGMALVCSHIAKSVEDKTNIQKAIRLDLVSGDFVDPFESMECTIYYCSICADHYAFPSYNSELPESEYENIIRKGFSGVCGKCFKEAKTMNS